LSPHRFVRRLRISRTRSSDGAPTDDIQTMAAGIRAELGSIDARAAPEMRILYGGSVSPDNFGAIWSCPDIDGALVGGASLESDIFLRLAAIASN